MTGTFIAMFSCTFTERICGLVNNKHPNHVMCVINRLGNISGELSHIITKLLPSCTNMFRDIIPILGTFTLTADYDTSFHARLKLELNWTHRVI